MTKTKLAKFEGTLGEFLEQYSQGKKFYQIDSGFDYEIKTNDISLLPSYYDGILWYYKEQTWEEYVQDGGKVLCAVSDIGIKKTHFVMIDDIYLTQFINIKT